MSDNRFEIATAHDVARLAGVSQSTVSRAFTPGASVAEPTRRRILAAADQLGYQPNLIARSLITRRSNIIGVAIGNLGNPFFAAALEALSLGLAGARLRLLLFNTDPDALVETRIHEVLQYRIDALVMLSTLLTSTLAEQCRKADIPVLLFNRTALAAGMSSVTGNNRGGARAIATFLAAGGHQRLAFMGGIESSSTSLERGEGFRERLAEMGRDPPIEENGGFKYPTAAAAARRLLMRPDRPDAIFCANDQMAIAAIGVAQAEFGLEVGRAISIVGFDDVPMAAWPSFSLTTYSQPIGPMITETIRILQALSLGEREPVQKVVEGELIIRNSARRPRV